MIRLCLNLPSCHLPFVHMFFASFFFLWFKTFYFFLSALLLRIFLVYDVYFCSGCFRAYTLTYLCDDFIMCQFGGVELNFSGFPFFYVYGYNGSQDRSLEGLGKQKWGSSYFVVYVHVSYLLVQLASGWQWVGLQAPHLSLDPPSGSLTPELSACV